MPREGIRFLLVLSLHGIGDLADSVFGIPGAFDRITKTWRR